MQFMLIERRPTAAQHQFDENSLLLLLLLLLLCKEKSRQTRDTQ